MRFTLSFIFLLPSFIFACSNESVEVADLAELEKHGVKLTLQNWQPIQNECVEIEIEAEKETERFKFSQIRYSVSNKQTRSILFLTDLKTYTHEKKASKVTSYICILPSLFEDSELAVSFSEKTKDERIATKTLRINFLGALIKGKVEHRGQELLVDGKEFYWRKIGNKLTIQPKGKMDRIITFDIKGQQDLVGVGKDLYSYIDIIAITNSVVTELIKHYGANTIFDKKGIVSAGPISDIINVKLAIGKRHFTYAN